jgi:cytochrome c oxidase subunit 4
MPQAQTQQRHAEPNYMGVFYWLAALTAIEVAIVYLGLPKLLLGALLVALAFSKAALVALYFMHLKFERRTLALIAVTPVLLCIFLIFMLVPDKIVSATRGAGEPTSSTSSH